MICCFSLLLPADFKHPGWICCCFDKWIFTFWYDLVLCCCLDSWERRRPANKTLKPQKWHINPTNNSCFRMFPTAPFYSKWIHNSFTSATVLLLTVRQSPAGSSTTEVNATLKLEAQSYSWTVPNIVMITYPDKHVFVPVHILGEETQHHEHLLERHRTTNRYRGNGWLLHNPWAHQPDERQRQTENGQLQKL